MTKGKGFLAAWWNRVRELFPAGDSRHRRRDPPHSQARLRTVASVSRLPNWLPLGATTDQNVQHVPDRLLAIGELRQGQVALHLVAISATLSLLDDIAGFGQIADDGVRVALGDPEIRSDVAQANLWILGDTEERSAMVGEEAPVGHEKKIPNVYRTWLLVPKL